MFHARISHRPCGSQEVLHEAVDFGDLLKSRRVLPLSPGLLIGFALPLVGLLFVVAAGRVFPR